MAHDHYTSNVIDPQCNLCTLAYAMRPVGYCDLHQRADCTLCDECGHEGALHASAHDDATLWPLVTCWAESVCSSCTSAAVPA